jgi:hypothetical protein
MTVYLAMALDLPPWAFKAIDKIRRGFLWKRRKDVRGTLSPCLAKGYPTSLWEDMFGKIVDFFYGGA